MAVNGPVGMPQALKPLCLIRLLDFPFPIIELWGNKNWSSSMKVKKDGKLLEQKGPRGMQMVLFECPRHWKTPVLSTFGISPFPLLALWGNNNWPSSMKVK